MSNFIFFKDYDHGLLLSKLEYLKGNLMHTCLYHAFYSMWIFCSDVCVVHCVLTFGVVSTKLAMPHVTATTKPPFFI